MIIISTSFNYPFEILGRKDSERVDAATGCSENIFNCLTE